MRCWDEVRELPAPNYAVSIATAILSGCGQVVDLGTVPVSLCHRPLCYGPSNVRSPGVHPWDATSTPIEPNTMPLTESGGNHKGE